MHTGKGLRTAVRILLLSNNYPTARAPSGATYITRRIEAHRAAGLEVDAYALQPASGVIWDGIRHVLGRPTNIDVALPSEVMSGPAGYLPTTYRDGMGLALRTRLGLSLEKVALQAARQLLPMVSGHHYDLVHGHGMYTVPAGRVAQIVASELEIPYVVTGHGSDINLAMPRRRVAYRNVLDHASAVAYVSAALRDRAHELGAHPRREVVIPNGVDLSVFRPREDTDPRTMSPDRPTIAYVGNLLEVKGADRLPRIFREISREVPGARFAVAGDGPLRARLERETQALDVAFYGRVQPAQVAAIMRNAAVLVLPSRSEGFGTVVLEALASGTAVVGSDVGGIPEAIGDSRFLVPESSTFEYDFAQLVTSVMADPPNALDLRQRAEHFSWAFIAAQEQGLYVSVLQGPGERETQ